jgi:hypothetical protein
MGAKEIRAKKNQKTTFMNVVFWLMQQSDIALCAYIEAVPTGFEPAISALTGPHVWPLHHGTS